MFMIPLYQMDVNFTHLSRTDHTTTRSHLEGREPGTTMYCSIPPHTYPTRGGDPSSKRIHPFPTGCDRSSQWDPENHGETISSHQSWKYTDHPGSLHTIITQTSCSPQVIEEHKRICDKIPKITHHNLYYPLLFKIFSD